ncbi:hypothetical protein [Legionella fallonii]|uniref:Uncharacterized protein n=1 Tax=Legionella fallonii LLAP-10 TaxID=1212491 RepID=A0A098G8J7_9GAMM|nr:hypothetical protein [Legionella fallonii]CEG58803.1 conserved exported protein of unknown function [Legionella fallonii LLAP-10]
MNHIHYRKKHFYIKKTIPFCILLASFLFSWSVSAQLISQEHLAEIKTYKYTFSDHNEFTVSFADYPKGQERFYELQFEKDAFLPNEIKTSSHSLKISGNNHSDDLFMFAYKKLSGLKANTRYLVSFSLEFASNAPSDSVGAGGSPGSSVFVKIGAVNKKPERYLDEANNYRMTLDKGNQAIDGKDMILIGTIGVDTHDSIYRLKTLPYQPDAEMQKKLDDYYVTSNDKGEAWLVVGTDSAYESTSTIFYTNLIASFKELK